MVENVVVLKSQDPLIQKLHFKPYRSTVERLVKQFVPSSDQPQAVSLKTPWGEILEVRAGDYLVSDPGAPENTWPVERDIFLETYQMIGPGRCIKKALTHLVPLTDITNGNEDQKVSIETLEGAVTVRAGDFHLSKGVKGGIWPMPNDKVSTTLAPLDA